MSILEASQRRGISEVLHFTTDRGLTGILAVNAIKPRSKLTEDEYLEHICKINCPDRSRDVQWHGYVNLSITSINFRLFNISSNNWHRDSGVWWCILSLKPEVLSHPGVEFATTNNMYSGVRRVSGLDGFEAIFAPRVHQYARNYATRSAATPDAQPTCVQAEALYPGDLSTDHLLRIYVPDEEHTDIVCGITGGLNIPPVPCIVRPELFGR